ncbi:MAG TPA: phosphoglycerate kinase [Symbiobacteriaceae bacterium]|jgi:phosphoglycerate kinase
MAWTPARIDPVPLHTLRDRWDEVKGLRVFLRVDLNLPTGPDHQILCDYRIRRVVGLVGVLSRMGCRVIVASHYGRPLGRPDPNLSLATFLDAFARQLEPQVTFLPDCVGPEVRKAIDGSVPGSVFLLENLRFHPGEDAADPEFAAQLAKLADVYVNDAFSVSHRYHASTVLLPHLLPAYAGPAFANEYLRAVTLLQTIRPPVVMISGGLKLDKLAVYADLMSRVDHLLLGSGFASTLRGRPELLTGEFASRTVLPVDLLVKSPDGGLNEVSWGDLKPDSAAIDIGPKTVALFREKIRHAGTLLFNGSLGALPFTDPYSSHHLIVDSFVAARGIKVVCGGTGVSLFINSSEARKVNYIFPGGGAILAFLNDQSNPAIPLLVKSNWSAAYRVAPSKQIGFSEGS